MPKVIISGALVGLAVITLIPALYLGAYLVTWCGSFVVFPIPLVLNLGAMAWALEGVS